MKIQFDTQQQYKLNAVAAVWTFSTGILIGACGVGGAFLDSECLLRLADLSLIISPSTANLLYP
jgi:uncharacterized membrane protein YfcA